MENNCFCIVGSLIIGYNQLLFLRSDDIIRSLEQNGHFVLMISLDLTKSLEVRKAGDQSK